MFFINFIFSQSTTNGKAIFTDPSPIYVGETGETRVFAALPLGYKYMIKWEYNKFYTAAGSSTLVLDIIDPGKGEDKPVTINSTLKGDTTSYEWLVDPNLFKGDVNNYQIRLYDSQCVPGKCTAPAGGRLVISVSQPFMIYNPPFASNSNPDLTSDTSSLVASVIVGLVGLVVHVLQ